MKTNEGIEPIKIGQQKEQKIKRKIKKYLKLTLKSDLNVGWAIPMEDVCCNRLGVPPISFGLFSLIPTGGGGGAKNPEAADGGNEVTVASDINWYSTLISWQIMCIQMQNLPWCAVSAGRANVADGVEWAFTILALLFCVPPVPFDDR